MKNHTSYLLPLTSKRKRLRSLAFLALLTLVVLAPLAIYLARTPREALADTFLKLDEGYGTSSAVNDSNGAVSAGSITNATWKGEEFCFDGKCLYFDGDGDYVSFGDDADLDFAGSDSFTLTGWFRHSPASAAQIILAKHTTSTGSDGGYKVLMESDGDITCGIDNDNSSFPSDSATSTAATYDDSRWHHFACVKSGSSTLTLYLDGLRVAQDPSITSSTLANGDSLYIGIDGDGASNDYLGFVDEIKIYRSAKTAAEINGDFVKGSTMNETTAAFGIKDLSYLSDGLVGYWKMDETATPSIDSSGNGNSGTWSSSSYTAGKFGNAAIFDASTDYIDAGSGSSLDTLTNWTATFWAYPTSISPGYEARILYKSSSKSISMFTDGTIRVVQGWSGTPDATAYTTSPLTVNTWTHITVTHDASTRYLKVYFNGIEQSYSTQDQATNSSVSNDDADTLYIGNRTPTDRGFPGYLDDVRIYSRVLNKSEINQLISWAPGPIGHWKLDENTGQNVYDSSGNDSAGTLGATSGSSTDDPTWAPGKFGSNLDFEDTSTQDYVEIGNYTPLQISDNGTVTITAWVNAESFPGNSENGVIAGKGQQGMVDPPAAWFTESYVLSVNTDGGGVKKLRMGSWAGSDYEATWTLTGWNIGEWHHVAGSYDGTTWHVYFDGVEKASTTTTGPYFNSANFYIGAYETAGSPDRYWDGLIDDVRVYNYARSAAQIIEDMNAGHPAPGSPIGSAIAEWQFDEGYSTTANDQSSNDNDLTLSTASWTNSGKFGKAWNGDGTIWLSRTNDADLDFGTTESFTLSGWFKSDSATNPANGIEYYLATTTGNTDKGYAVYFNTTGTVCFAIDDDTTWEPDSSTCTTADYYDGTWHNFVAVRNVTADTIAIYIDGEVKDSDIDATTATLDGDNVFYVGDFDGDNNGTSGTEEFAGDIDALYVFRSALTPDQIRQMYTGGQAAVWGNTGTTSTGTASNAAADAYCPPGQGSACTGPFAEWKLDENTGGYVYDTSGNNYFGYVGTIALAESYDPIWDQGKFGSGLHFDGTDDLSEISDINAMDNVAALTMSGWVKFDSLEDWNALFGKGNDANNYTNLGLSGSGHQDSDDIECNIANGGDAGMYTKNNIIQVGIWYHVACVFDSSQTGDDKIKIYVNGTLQPSTSYGSIPTYTDTNSEKLNLGWAAVGGSAAYLDGTLDEVKFYNYARTPAQIAWDYNQGGPVGWWKFDENTSGDGQTVYDASSNGNNGTTEWGSAGMDCTVTGKYYKACDFDGSDDYIAVTHDPAFLFADSNSDLPFTLSAWVNFADDDSGRIITKGEVDMDTFGAYSLYIDSDDKLNLMLEAMSGELTARSSSALTENTWHHIVATYDGSETYAGIKFYVNGTPITTTNASVSSYGGMNIDNAGNIHFGARYNFGSMQNFLNAQLDEIRIYRYALNPTQVKLLFDQDSAVKFGP